MNGEFDQPSALRSYWSTENMEECKREATSKRESWKGLVRLFTGGMVEKRVSPSEKLLWDIFRLELNRERHISRINNLLIVRSPAADQDWMFEQEGYKEASHTHVAPST